MMNWQLLNLIFFKMVDFKFIQFLIPLLILPQLLLLPLHILNRCYHFLKKNLIAIASNLSFIYFLRYIIFLIVNLMAFH